MRFVRAYILPRILVYFVWANNDFVMWQTSGANK